MRILFCWSDISGYMVACWKELASQPDIDLHIIAYKRSDETNFDKGLTQGLNIYFVDREPQPKFIKSLIHEISPETIIICGWFIPAYRRLVFSKDLQRISFILTMDTPWQGTLRQQIARLLLRPLLSRLKAVLSSGERSYQYAKRLGANKIFKVQYGVDTTSLGKNLEARLQKPWPKKFLYVGRYAQEKGIKTLVEAYLTYQSETEIPWELHTCGMGPLEELITGSGIHNHGFVQPDEMDKIWQNAGCLILPSTYDPWPLIVLEACAAGLPVICTHASGSQVEAVKMYWNGLVINADDSEELVEAFKWIHSNEKSLPEMGKRSIQQAEPYGASAWSNRLLEIIKHH